MQISAQPWLDFVPRRSDTMNSIRINRSQSSFLPTRGSVNRGLLLGIVAAMLGFQVGLPPTAAAV
jgi:hypothetical protein